MKRYKLQKDTPTLKAGTILEQLNDERLFLRASENCVAVPIFQKEDVENFNEWFEEIPEKYKRYRPVKGDCYKCCGGKNVYNSCWTGVDIDEQRFNTGNCYSLDTPDEDIIHEQYEIPKALQTIKDDAKGFKPDWQDDCQPKFYGQYDHYDHKLCNDYVVGYREQGVVYFASKEDIEESFKNHRKEWLTVLGVKENE